MYLLGQRNFVFIENNFTIIEMSIDDERISPEIKEECERLNVRMLAGEGKCVRLLPVPEILAQIRSKHSMPHVPEMSL